MENCEYIGCSHVGERKCGIKDALESNEINKSRYDNYVKIYQELKKKEDNKYK